MKTQWSARAVVAALVCAALVAATAPAASASTPTVHAAPVWAKVTKLPPDGTCDDNPDFPKDQGDREDHAGIVWTRLGPARIDLRLCHMFTGAIASTRLYGAFSIRTYFGTLRGSVDGAEEHTPYEYPVLTLTVERGTWWLFNVRGTMHLEGQVGPQPGFAGTLTSDLHRSWGARRAPTSFPFT
jgi:hypothetical protein